MHQPIPEQGRWLAQVVRGYFAYHAVPTNAKSLVAFRGDVKVLWMRAMQAQSERHTRPGSAWPDWRRSSYPNCESFIPGQTTAALSSTRGGSRVPESGPLGFVRGAPSNGRPYRDQSRSTQKRATPITEDTIESLACAIRVDEQQPRGHIDEAVCISVAIFWLQTDLKRDQEYLWTLRTYPRHSSRGQVNLVPG